MNDVTDSSNNINRNNGLDYLREVESSTCLLLPNTPSPHPMDFKHPLSDEITEDFLEMPGAKSVVTNPGTEGDSSSSGDANSVIQDPVSAQLINNISMLDYQTLSKADVHLSGQVDPGKVNGNMNLGNKKLPSFVNWNWNIIRKLLLWVVVSSLVALTGTIIAMIVALPKTCNPELPWYQGKVFYEVFPTRFGDANNDGFGDFKGLQKRLSYIKDMEVTAIRLNYIFETVNHRGTNESVTTLTNIARELGTLVDFQDLVKEIHSQNMSIILDLPVLSMMKIKYFNAAKYNTSLTVPESELATDIDTTTDAIQFWSTAQNVDGFYLKDLEKFIHDPYLELSLQTWKNIIGSEKILIVSEAAFKNCTGTALNVLLSRVDLVDVHIGIFENSHTLRKRIEEVITSSLWNKPFHPWVHWNIGGVGYSRISSVQQEKTLPVSFLEMILPGTINIFYGDEMGIHGLQNTETDSHEHDQLHNLIQMQWYENETKSSSKILPWKSGSHAQLHFLELIKRLIKVRLATPTVYLRAIYKEGKMYPNTQVRRSDGNIIVIERWYPRRNTVVFIANFGNSSITTDMTTMFYGGEVLAATNSSLLGTYVYFDEIALSPFSALVVRLEK